MMMVVKGSGEMMMVRRGLGDDDGGVKVGR